MGNMKVFLSILIVGMLFLSCLGRSKSDSDESPSSTLQYNVLDFGAAGDGSHDDTNAFMKAWKATCKMASRIPPTMVIPSGKKFLIQPVEFKGPCNSPQINVQISGEIVAPKKPSDWKCKGDCHVWMLFKDLTGLNLYGDGSIHGQGQKWWEKKGKKKPAAMQIEDSKNVNVANLNFKDNPRMHFILKQLQSVYVNNVTIVAPEKSPNTDGIHVTGSTNVTIENCNIGTGDDCISIVDGSSYVRGSNISCGPGHGVSIGSLGKNGADDRVEHVEMRDIVFTNTQNGARIKTWQGGRGYAKHIKFERVQSNGAKNPIIIDQFYCDHTKCTDHESAVQIEDVTFRKFTGTSKKSVAVKFSCSKTVPCRNIIAEDIYLVSTDGKENTSSICENVKGTIYGRQVPKVSCLMQSDDSDHHN
ncbi:OLC1v1020457C1 [Oldenlandia corymbosa var. corymbosa]|uniref:endo-polygalacturonase n=1 Tax=Oldenlandia corymbosa var. corymbosa TaxID=529605 RepID=A0AAV1EGG7_OLDCO|nr:OLC1v1020457C1 [Oldenlandia corymbosa var. corymbosa]